MKTSEEIIAEIDERIETTKEVTAKYLNAGNRSAKDMCESILFQLQDLKEWILEV